MVLETKRKMVDVVTNGKRGRPKLDIDFELVERLAHIHCTQQEIATTLGLNVKTLQRNAEFCLVYKKGLDKGKKSLRRLQWEKAEGRDCVLARDDDGKILVDDKHRPIVLSAAITPDTTMQIWLGKQLLGQRDQREIMGEGGGAIPIRIVEVRE